MAVFCVWLGGGGEGGGVVVGGVHVVGSREVNHTFSCSW